MAKYHKIYDEFFQIGDFSPRMCELTGARRDLELHHIDARGMGGRQSADGIENIMCLHRVAHEYFGDKTKFKEWLKEAHRNFMEKQIPLIIRNPQDQVLGKFVMDEYRRLRK